MNMLRDWGFKVRCGPEVFSAPGLWGGHGPAHGPALRGHRLDPEVKAVLAARGGYGCLKLLPHLDVPALAAVPKRLVGFSDLTNLLWDLHRRLKLVTFHGPNLAQLPDLTPAARKISIGGSRPRARPYPTRTSPCCTPGWPRVPWPAATSPPCATWWARPMPPKCGVTCCSSRTTTKRCTAWTACSTTCSSPESWTGSRAWCWVAFTNCGSRDGLLEVLTTALAPLEVPVLMDLPVGHQPDNHTPAPGGVGQPGRRQRLPDPVSLISRREAEKGPPPSPQPFSPAPCPGIRVRREKNPTPFTRISLRGRLSSRRGSRRKLVEAQDLFSLYPRQKRRVRVFPRPGTCRPRGEN